MAGNAIENLRSVDAATKPAGADDEWMAAHLYYSDCARQRTRTRLAELGLGIKANSRPIEVGLMRRIVDRLSVVYSQPPTRWLKRPGGSRLRETSSEHRLMVDLLTRAQADLAWRRVDRLRTLFRQVVVRFYASDARGSVVMRIFEPFNVMRSPDHSAPDCLDQDHEFALMLLDSPVRQVWEHWIRTGDGWRMRVVDGDGRVIDSPYGDDARNPYGHLPAMMIYDEIPMGRAWIPPRSSRISMIEALNAMANDLWALVVHEAHSKTVVSTDDTAGVPGVTGPGTVWVMPKDSTVATLTNNPKINDSQAVYDGMLKKFNLAEDLPTSEFDDKKQVLTGAALRVQERPLLDRRSAQAPLALEDERIAWAKMRSIHNMHAGTTPAWDLGVANEDLELEIELAELYQPTDGREMMDSYSRAIALGAKSVIDLIQQSEHVPRHTAIKIWERVQEDRLTYPPMVDPAAVQPPGPRLSGIVNDPFDKSPSVLDAIETLKTQQDPS